MAKLIIDHQWLRGHRGANDVESHNTRHLLPTYNATLNLAAQILTKQTAAWGKKPRGNGFMALTKYVAKCTVHQLVQKRVAEAEVAGWGKEGQVGCIAL